MTEAPALRPSPPDLRRNPLLVVGGWLLFGLWVAGEFVSHIGRKEPQ